MDSVSCHPLIPGPARLISRARLLALFAGALLPSLCSGQIIPPLTRSGDHLSCFTFRDRDPTAIRQKYTVRMPFSQFDSSELSQVCIVKTPPRLVCLPSRMGGGPSGGPPFEATHTFFCYKAMCTRRSVMIDATDQFGHHQGEVSRLGTIC